MTDDRIYFDHAATTALRPEVQAAMLPFQVEYFGNASSLHTEGQAAHAALEEARTRILHCLQATDFRAVFTASGTEADNSALIGAVLAARESTTQGSYHVVATAIEHSAVLEALPLVEALGGCVTVVDVDSSGCVDPKRVEAALRDDTILVSVMAVNNETGVVQPIAEIGERLKARRVLFHTDGVQIVGKLSLDLSTLPVDLVSLSAHKIYGPKGVGCLLLREDVPWCPWLRGGAQEVGLRAGTENVAAAVGFARALELAEEEREFVMQRLETLREDIEQAVRAGIPQVVVNGCECERVATILNLSFRDANGEALVRRLDHDGIAVSTGSACNVGAHKSSHVLSSMGRSEREVRGAIRISLGRENHAREVDRFVERLQAAHEHLSRLAPRK